MSDAYVAYVRCGERVLIMQRADEVADFPGSWDGVYGIGDPDDVDAVAVRITECTGIPTEDLQHVRSGAARGLAFGNRLNDVTPILFISESSEVSPRTIYKAHEWVDPAYIETVKSDHSEGTGASRYSIPKLGDMYGDVASYLYILKTSIGSAPRRETHRNGRNDHHPPEELSKGPPRSITARKHTRLSRAKGCDRWHRGGLHHRD